MGLQAGEVVELPDAEVVQPGVDVVLRVRRQVERLHHLLRRYRAVVAHRVGQEPDVVVAAEGDDDRVYLVRPRDEAVDRHQVRLRGAVRRVVKPGDPAEPVGWHLRVLQARDWEPPAATEERVEHPAAAAVARRVVEQVPGEVPRPADGRAVGPGPAGAPVGVALLCGPAVRTGLRSVPRGVVDGSPSRRRRRREGRRPRAAGVTGSGARADPCAGYPPAPPPPLRRPRLAETAAGLRFTPISNDGAPTRRSPGRGRADRRT